MYEWHTVAISDFAGLEKYQHRAYLNPEEDWNGWACPYFKKEEAERMSSWLPELGEALSYDEKADEFIIGPEDCPEDSEHFPAVDIDGKKLYPIGTHSWVWEII